MGDSTSTVFVPLFFLHTTLGMGVLSWWFLKNKKQTLKDFGMGLAGYTAGLAVWTTVVITKPDDLKPLIVLGVIPFLLAHIAFAKAASAKLPTKSSTLMTITLVLLAATFLARTFFFKSEPYFSSKGLLFFGLKAVPVALYIATISVSFLPAIRAAAADIKDKALKTVLGTGLTILYVNSIILVSAKDESLLLINGLVLTGALLFSWLKVATSATKS